MVETRVHPVKGVPSFLCLHEIVEYGTDSGRGNLVGIQPHMVSTDYVSEGSFRDKVGHYMRVAHEQGWFGERTTVVLPEHIGTWLVAAGESVRVHRAGTVERGMRALALGHPFAFLKAIMFAQADDVAKYGLFRIKASHMARVYQDVFSGLAVQYGVTLVAGSLVLPSPQVSDGRLVTTGGALYNVSVVYRPDGTPYPDIVRKAYPIADEVPFTARGPVSELPVYNTPAGRLGVLICADSWYPESYQVLQSQRAELLAVPSFLTSDGIWDRPWQGYNVWPAPRDVDPGDACHILEGEAWLKYAMAARIASAGIEHGINVFLRGEIWDLGSDGHTTVVNGGHVLQAEHVAGAAIVNSWL